MTKAKDARAAEKGNGRKMVPASVTFPAELLIAADARASSLDLTRSQYFRRLAKQDLEAQPARKP